MASSESNNFPHYWYFYNLPLIKLIAKFLSPYFIIYSKNVLLVIHFAQKCQWWFLGKQKSEEWVLEAISGSGQWLHWKKREATPPDSIYLIQWFLYRPKSTGDNLSDYQCLHRRLLARDDTASQKAYFKVQVKGSRDSRAGVWYLLRDKCVYPAGVPDTNVFSFCIGNYHGGLPRATRGLCPRLLEPDAVHVPPDCIFKLHMVPADSDAHINWVLYNEISYHFRKR